MSEDNGQQSSKDANEDKTAVYEQVVTLLNDAQTTRDATSRINNLRQVQELIVHQHPDVLDNFLDEMLGFQNDTNPEVKKFLLSFMEVACRQDQEVLSKIVANLMLMLGDENVNVQKKVIMTSEQLYQLALAWVAKTRKLSDVMEHTWEYFVRLKNKILELVDSENDGVRTRVIKFMETCVLLQSCKTADSEKTPVEMVSLEQVTRDHKFLSYRKLEAEGKTMFQRLLDVVTAQHVSSINLITCLNALARIARQRPEFMEKVVIAFETVQVNLPPTLAKTQVTSVRKELKKHLLSLLRHPKATDFVSQMTTLLTDLGASEQEILKNMPAPPEPRKRTRKTDEDATTSKRTREAEPEDDHDDEDEGEAQLRTSAIDITADYLFGKLTPQNVADLVLLSMVMLPDVMPAQFQSTYTPISAAGTLDQIRHLARMMSTQFTAVGLGPGVEQIKVREKESKRIDQAREEVAVASTHQTELPTESKREEKKPVVFLPSGFQVHKTSKRLHQFGLAHITKPMSADQLYKMSYMAFERIMNAEKRVRQGGAAFHQMKLLVSIVSNFNIPGLRERLEDYILSNQKERSDVAILWIHHAYASYQGFSTSVLQDTEKGLEKYSDILTRILELLFSRGDHKESLFHRILLEAPQVTIPALNILKKAAQDPVHGSFTLDTLKQMILTKSRQRTEFMGLLLEFTTYENYEIRHQCLQMATELYQNPATRENVSWHMSMYLQYLLTPSPPNLLFGVETGRPINPGKWDETSTKACLYLHLSLLPVDHKLIHNLAKVYVEASSDIKRVILRTLESPVKAIGMHSPELLSLVETCPKGAETLVTRIVHLLTERQAPSVELVNRIRDLYHKRVPDVRFLIPVLTGLSKKEIIAALPKLIKLNTVVVKEVFSRLLHGQSVETGSLALSPSELLLALHQLDSGSVDMKALVNASNILLADRNIYTQEVLAGVIQQLVDQNPLPTLLMRTVLQALAMYPRLIGFLMNILQRLIMKQVWKQQLVWEGFVRCCQKTRPQSFQVLLQLPPAQLKQVFILCPDLREPLLQHINGLSAYQQGHISQSIMKVVQTDPAEYLEGHQQPQQPIATVLDGASAHPTPDGPNSEEDVP